MCTVNSIQRDNLLSILTFVLLYKRAVTASDYYQPNSRIDAGSVVGPLEARSGCRKGFFANASELRHVILTHLSICQRLLHIAGYISPTPQKKWPAGGVMSGVLISNKWIYG